MSYFQPIYCSGSPGGLVVGTSSYICGYTNEWACTEAKTVCTVTDYPEQAAEPPIPAIPPTPAQTIANFQEGWNASAQSVQSIAIDEGYLFKVGNGTRGALLGLGFEPWAPNVGTLPYGIMFSDGEAQIYENGELKETLGNFFRGEEFIIARADNYVLYYNMTAGIYVIREGIPAPSSVPLYLFSMLYTGGDTVIT